MFGRGMHGRGFGEGFQHHHRPFFLDKMIFKNWRENWNWHSQSEALNQNSMNFLIMYILNEKPSYGYELIKAIEEKFNGVYCPEAEEIYPNLAKLEDMGFLVSNVEENKKIYSVTEEGKAYLEINKDKVDSVLKTVDEIKNGLNKKVLEEVYIKVKTIGITIFGKLRERSWSNEQLKKLLSILENTAKEISEI